MKKELEHFFVRKGIGGNQDILLDPVLHFAGCGAIAAAESSIFLSLYFGRSRLCEDVKKQWGYFEYLRFVKRLKPCLYPKERGITRLDLYTEGYQQYLDKVGETTLSMTEFSAEETEQDAVEAVKKQIDCGYLIPFLLLKNQHKELKDFHWHWFFITGYDDREGFRVRLTSYGENKWFDFHKLWDTGYEEKGGMILYEVIE